MHFCMDADDGDCVRGWIAPNNPSSIPKVVVVRPGQAELVVEANVMREGIREMGLHETGQVGFAIGKDLVPEIAALDEFILLEAESRLPIFHRTRAPAPLKQKLCMFDTAVAQDNVFRDTTSKYFNLSYFCAESIPLETMMSVINNKFTDSIFIHGRPSVFRYTSMLNDANFRKAALLTNPFVDLAARLMYVKAFSQALGDDAGSGELRELECLVSLANALPFDDPKGMAAVFRDATPQQIRALADPMTRLFACEPNEEASHRHVSLALESLSTMDLVGTRARFDVFSKTLHGLIGNDIFEAQDFAMVETVKTVAKSLAQIKFVNEWLENDVILYSWAEQAVGLGVQIARS
jgi:hypothetical protein